MNENDLLNRLAASKKIMDIHNKVPRGQVRENVSIQNTEVQEFNVPESKYNIPQEYMTESKPQIPQYANSKDRIMSSKLPDEIKRLMIEHPIQQQSPMNPASSVLSDELIQKASRLMNNNVANNVSHFDNNQPIKENLKSQNVTSNLDKNVLKDLIRETIEEVLGENGLLVESTSKSNDVFQFRVGSHIFEGKVTKIKKVK